MTQLDEAVKKEQADRDEVSPLVGKFPELQERLQGIKNRLAECVKKKRSLQEAVDECEKAADEERTAKQRKQRADTKFEVVWRESNA